MAVPLRLKSYFSTAPNNVGHHDEQALLSITEMKTDPCKIGWTQSL